MQGDNVSFLQNKLVQLEFEIFVEEIKKEFCGTSTLETVIKFQQMHGLVDNTIVLEKGERYDNDNKTHDNQSKGIVDDGRAADALNYELDICLSTTLMCYERCIKWNRYKLPDYYPG